MKTIEFGNADIARAFTAFEMETRLQSNPAAGMDSKSAHILIALGKKTVRYIFQSAQPISVHTMTLLVRITGTDPTERRHAGQVLKMQEDWKKWAQNKGYC